MVKSKRRQLAALAARKEHTLGDLVEPSHSVTEEDLLLGDEWVIVKKQKITILIPSLQPTTTQGRRNKHIQRRTKKTIKRQPPILKERLLQHSGDELHKADALASKVDTQVDQKNTVSPPDPMKNLPKPASRIVPKGPNRLLGDSMYLPSSLNQVRDQHVWGARTPSQGVVASGVLKAVERPSLPLSVYRQRQTLFPRSIGCLNVGVIQNKKMRASNLERKLEKAGGLSRWLLSQRLGQFVQIFRRKNIDKFQLLNLTMAKLKDMGVLAVGPRRKLIHAIECLSQPYCFKTL